jgi:sporulation protein YunB
MRIKKSDYVILITILIFALSFIEIKVFSFKSEPILLQYATNKITNITNNIINESINRQVYNYKYNDIIIVEKDKNGNIVSVDFNNETINSMLYVVTSEVLDKLELLEIGNYEELELQYVNITDNVYYLPYGIIYENSILSNLGPKIPFKVSLIGSTNNNTKINIEEYGINSSKVEVILDINIKMMVVLPFKSNIIDINKTIILDSKIIQGKVPDYYGGLFSVN